MQPRRAAARAPRRRRSSTRRRSRDGPSLVRSFRRSASGSARCLALAWFEVEKGLVSVIPQACITSTPRSANWSNIAGGHAEPPMTTRFKVDSFEVLRLQILEQAEPHRRHAAGERHPLFFEELVQARAVELRARQHQLGSDQARRVRQAPGKHVKHGRYRHHHFTRRQIEAVGKADAQCVQQRGAMRIEHALGIAGGARGVAKRRRRVLVELGPLETIALGRRATIRNREVSARYRASARRR